jgi:alpha-L-fucosidase
VASLELDLGKVQVIRYFVIQEYIRLGQRVKAFNIEAMENNEWKTLVAATTIGYKRILRVDPVHTDRVRINITASKACPVLSNVEVY